MHCGKSFRVYSNPDFIGVQLGGHLRVVPSASIPVGERGRLRIGARVEVAGSSLAQDAGVARLLVSAPDGTTSAVARVGGLELFGGLELGFAWSLPTGRVESERAD